MSELRSFILNASVAALAVDKAKVDLEEAKQRVEIAKNAVAEAGAAYDEALGECEAAGLIKSKVKKAVDEINAAFALAGIVEVAPETTTVTNAAEKPARKKRKGKEEDLTEQTNDASESETNTDTLTLDNSEGVAEILSIFEEAAAVSKHERTDEALAYFKEILEMFARDFDGIEVDLAGFRDYLMAGFLPATGDQAFFVESFVDVIDSLESQVVVPLLPSADQDEVAVDLAAEDEVVEVLVTPVLAEEQPVSLAEDIMPQADEVSEVQEAVGEAEVAVEAPQVVEEPALVDTTDADDETYFDTSGDPTDDYADYDDAYAAVISDDETFPITGEPEEMDERNIQVVEDIDAMNFLSAASEAQPEAKEAPVAPAEAQSKTEEAPKPRKAFQPPAFMQKK